MQRFWMTTAASLLVLAAPAMAADEVGDAGETLATAQVVGNVTIINGTLANLGTAPIDDIDLYQIFLSSPTTTTVTVTSNLTADNDSQLFLFDSAGVFLVVDDDSGPGLLPQLDPEDFAGLLAGTYYLGINLFNTDPILAGGVLSGWNRNPVPFQTGPYTINISQDGAVPEPTTWAMILFGFGATGLAMRRRRATLQRA